LVVLIVPTGTPGFRIVYFIPTRVIIFSYFIFKLKKNKIKKVVAGHSLSVVVCFCSCLDSVGLVRAII